MQPIQIVLAEYKSLWYEYEFKITFGILHEMYRTTIKLLIFDSDVLILLMQRDFNQQFENVEEKMYGLLFPPITYNLLWAETFMTKKIINRSHSSHTIM